MADNRRRMPSSAYLKEEMTEATDVHLQHPSGAWVGVVDVGVGVGMVLWGGGWGGKGPECRAFVGRRWQKAGGERMVAGCADCSPLRLGSHAATASAAGMMVASRSNTSLQPTRLVVERRWRLGLSSRAHPSSIMQVGGCGGVGWGSGWGS